MQSLEDWFLKTLDPSERAHALTVHNHAASQNLIEMQKQLTTRPGTSGCGGGGSIHFSFEGVAQYRDMDAYGQWNPLFCELFLLLPLPPQPPPFKLASPGS